ncbi:hypothetical protein ABL78_4513 [Leptomonas seymouri]|uniref:Uncharacterized protein n=1 Tax=Leptomonas seymouri TaxID=5684 RepID=A0A0N1I3F4_LEPSE|nr:hypothetical protein ABL78_4513 [Leptomonas seymouri]|eukprot:KPI86434.1 hypothetical protein ABL78_4513 [Leptomonas seymouri]
MSPVTPSALACAWWRQHGLQERVRRFRSSHPPTPPRQTLNFDSGASRAPHRSHAVPGISQLCLFPSAESTAGAKTLTSSPVILVSACLLGYPVTYRGAEVRLPATLRPTPLLFLTEVLWRELGLVRCVPVCPEVEWLGLPVPRPPLRLVCGVDRDARESLDGAQGKELCHVVDAAAPDRIVFSFNPSAGELPSAVVANLAAPLHAIDGVVLKSRSPSCGVHDARLYSRDAAITSTPSCKACSRSRPTGVPASQCHPAASDSTSYKLVDGFFAKALRNSLRASSKAPGDREAGGGQSSLPLPVITSDRLLTQFHAVDSDAPRSSCHSPRALTFRAKGEVGLEHTSLDVFMESVLQHREWRLAQRAD